MRRWILSTLTLVLAFPLTASAHKMWLLPSQTVLSGPEPLITVDAAISNDLFYFNHFPLPLQNLSITAPDGSSVGAENQATGRYRGVFDVSLKQKGTYRITVPMSGVFASWEANGERQRWRGKKEDFASKVPTDAKDLQVSESVGRVETFVSNGKPTSPSFKSEGVGIELVPITHPNDLYAGEEAQLQFLVDGKPMPGLKVEVVRGGTRYRDSQQEIHATTDSDGKFSVRWPEPGMYWIETSTSDDKVTFKQAKQRSLGYTVTLEVLPQ